MHISFALALLFVSFAYAGWPTGKKTWSVGGQFSNVVTSQNSTIGMSNLASFGLSSTNWKAYGSGLNGPVYGVTVDTYGTVYAVGAFNSSGDTFTGPVARWKNDAWSPLGTDMIWSEGSYVRSVSVDCYTVPTGVSLPDCDVYIGGKFKLSGLSFSGSAINVAYFKGSDKAWKEMGSTSSAAPLATEEIRSVYKKGSIGISASKNYVWVAGTGGLRMFNLESKTWSDRNTLNWPTTAGTINWIHYKRNLVSTDEIYLCGDFTINNCANTKNCVNVVKYDYSQKTFSGIAQSYPLNGSVSSCQLGDDQTFYVAGKFKQSDLRKYLLRASTMDLANSNWDIQASLIENIQVPLTGLDVCASNDGDCTAGSIAVIGEGGFAGFYNAKDQSFNKFGLGVVGEPYSICSSVNLLSAAPRSSTCSLLSVIIVFAAAMFAYLL